MSINYLILGYLSWRPMSGYDLKKIIAESETLPWSANNNQIYKALVKLHRDKLVTKEVEEQTGSPNRHVYAITDHGLTALKDWVVSAPEPPQTRKPFLNQLLWADRLTNQELDELLAAYMNSVGEKLFFLRVQADKKPNMPERSTRERYLWEMVNKNWIIGYEFELKWVRQLRQDLVALEAEEQRQRAREKRQAQARRS